jgi:methionine synthase II (cobalamin-independent)
MSLSTPPFRADHVGSLLRPAEVLEAVRNWAGDELEDDMTLLVVRATEAKEATEPKER